MIQLTLNKLALYQVLSIRTLLQQQIYFHQPNCHPCTKNGALYLWVQNTPLVGLPPDMQQTACILLRNCKILETPLTTLGYLHCLQPRSQVLFFVFLNKLPATAAFYTQKKQLNSEESSKCVNKEILTFVGYPCAN